MTSCRKRRHPPQVVQLTHVRDVTAREPVQCAVIPMLPELYGLVRRGHPVAQTGDDHPAVLGNHRFIVQRAVVGQPGVQLVAVDVGEPQAQPHHFVGREPFVEQLRGGDDGTVGDHSLEPVFDRRQQRRGVAAQRKPGQCHALNTGVAQVIHDGAEVMHGLGHRLGEAGQTAGEVAVTAERREPFRPPTVKRQGVQQHIVARPVIPRQREEQSVEQVRRPHEAMDDAERRAWSVIVAPVLRARNAIGAKRVPLLSHRRVDRGEAATERDVVDRPVRQPLGEQAGVPRPDFW